MNYVKFEDHIYDTVQSFPVGGQRLIMKNGQEWTLLPEVGYRLEDCLGQVWEYRGISSFMGDNLSRVKGWQKI